MKIDLEDLERKARAAVGGEWEVHDAALITCDNRDDIADASDMGWSPGQCRDNALHIAANSPPVTLALIARIRELEDELRGFIDLCETDRSIPEDPERLRSILDNGAAAP